MKKLRVTVIMMALTLTASASLMAQVQDPNYSSRVQDRKNVTPKQTCQSIRPVGIPLKGQTQQSPSTKPTRANGIN
jgi:hypothetical protein